GEPCPKTYVECAAVEMLAVFGDPERGALQHRVGLGRPIGGEDACALRINCLHHRNEKINDAYINSDRRRGMEVAQEDRQISHCRGKRPVIVTIQAVKPTLRWRKPDSNPRS